MKSVHNNPVKAELFEQPDDYFYTWAKHSAGEKGWIENDDGVKQIADPQPER